jgi:predicted RNA-binding Zn-ribbon protein involved in translation (DUF1610 family)
MPNSTYFIQECPTCGRRLQIRVEYLGRKVTCPHCHGQLVAIDPARAKIDSADCGNALLRRAEKLLQTVAEQKGAPRSAYRAS